MGEREKHTAGAKAGSAFQTFAARLKSCPDTYPGSTRVFPRLVGSCPRKKLHGRWRDPMAGGWDLWSPTHRAKDARWMGRPRLQFHIISLILPWGFQMAEIADDCIAFRCQMCSLPILLRHDDFLRLRRDQEGQASDAGVLTLVGNPCRRANIYSLQKGSPYFDPATMNTKCFRSGATNHLLTLQCAEETCTFRA